jgi:threonylcarbamoyladenosine tRNA methylthiotransferase MtaB
MIRKVAFKTLGCRLNQYETDSVLTDFYRSGFEVVDFKEPADVYIVNTCTVTNQGDHKSKTAISQAVNGKSGSLVIVTGCMAEKQREYLLNRGGVNYVVDNKHKSDIYSLVQAHFNGELPVLDNSSGDVFGFTLAEKSFHTRSMVKIQDGCDNFCSYCIVPSVRGSAVSRPAADILDNISRVVDLGFKEVVLTGVNISRYEHNGLLFTGLLERILRLNGEFRVRISSVEPEGFNASFYDLFSHEKLCPHLHLCLQSGSDNVLTAMRRTYKVSSYLNIVDELRKRQPLFNFTTDIIVGFPGETADDFKSTCRVIEEIGFTHVHTFKFSVRSGTKAEAMTNQVPEKAKQERSLIVREISAENKRKYRQKMIGKSQTVLVEKVNKTGISRGYGENYVPVEFKQRQTGTNYFETVIINGMATASHDYILKA